MLFNLCCLVAKYREAEEPVNEGEKNVDTEKQLEQEDVGDANKDTSVPEQEEKEEPEEKVSAFPLCTIHGIYRILCFGSLES